ncbi:unnamed protein product [Schistosoma mattheei]|uniref:WASH-7_N domain-containing protein n=1 Tax=Schistosoma mattheei TaxID=31246 RepID=A0AA85B095_9TREM|nr:unnamed protein product [Schistosoma mattheei]
MKNCTIFIVLENTVSNLMASSRLIKRYDLNRLKVEISNIMVEICESRKLSISNIINNRMVVEYNDNNNLMNSTIDLEIFISELHVLVDYFFEYLCYFMVNLRNQISVNENFIRSFTSTSFTMSMKSSNVSSSSSSSSSSSASSSSRLTCPVITSNSISKLIDDLIDIESHMPMKYNEQYTEAQKRLSIRINLQVNKNKE